MKPLFGRKERCACASAASSRVGPLLHAAFGLTHLLLRGRHNLPPWACACSTTAPVERKRRARPPWEPSARADDALAPVTTTAMPTTSAVQRRLRCVGAVVVCMVVT